MTRLDALKALLAQPDEPGMRPRKHLYFWTTPDPQKVSPWDRNLVKAVAQFTKKHGALIRRVA